MTAALLLLPSCAVTIHDFQYCSPIPGGLGAACDNFLTANQLILDEPGWEALQASWIAQGQAVECTTSTTVGDLKAELEKLCSKTRCNYETKQAVKTAVRSLEKMLATGVASRALMIR